MDGDNEVIKMINPEESEELLRIAERQGIEITDSMLLRCKAPNEALVLSLNLSGLNLKELAYLLGYEEHPEQVSRMIGPDGNLPWRRANEFMDKVGNDIPLRWLALKRGYGLIRLQYVVERENEQLRDELVKKDERVAYLEGLLEAKREVQVCR